MGVLSGVTWGDGDGGPQMDQPGGGGDGQRGLGEWGKWGGGGGAARAGQVSRPGNSDRNPTKLK